MIANDLKQADSRVAKYLRRSIELNPNTKKIARTVGYTTKLPSFSFIEAIPIDPTGEAGSNADMLTWSELWGSNEDAKARMWSEMTLSPTKRGKSFRWIESYAGFHGESKLLYSLYELGVKQGELLWPDRLYPVTGGEPTPLELYVNKDAGMICLWNTQPRCPWQTVDYYRDEEKILLPNEFLRMHRNQWVSSTETFVPMLWYDECKRTDAEWPNIPKNHPMVIVADAAVSGDCFGVWMGCRHPDNENDVVKVYARKWTPPKGGKIDFQGTDDDPGPEMEIRRLCKTYNVVWMTYDQYQLHDMMTRLYKDGVAVIHAFGQETRRLLSDSQLRTLVRDRRYWHRGESDEREHFENAEAKITGEDSKIRIVKKTESGKIDLCVCASMGSFEVLRLNL